MSVSVMAHPRGLYPLGPRRYNTLGQLANDGHIKDTLYSSGLILQR